MSDKDDMDRIASRTSEASEIHYDTDHIEACRDMLRRIQCTLPSKRPPETGLRDLLQLSDDDWRRYMARWCAELLRTHITAVEYAGHVKRYADDGFEPWRSDDPRWVDLIELAGGYEACRAAVAAVDSGRHTTDEVFAGVGEVVHDPAPPPTLDEPAVTG